MILIKQIGKNMLKVIQNPKIIIYYILGHYRYSLYYSKYKFLLRKSIINKISILNTKIDKECFNSASCKNCGCKVPQQNYGGKPCDCEWLK